MAKSSETKSYGSIRKFKKFGTCGVVLGMAALGMGLTSAVSANEVAKTDQAVIETKAVTEGSKVESEKSNLIEEPVVKTEVPKDKDLKVENKENEIVQNDDSKKVNDPKEEVKQVVPEKNEPAKEETKTSQKTLKEAISEAEKVGISVVHGEEVVYEDEATAKQDTDKQVKHLETLKSEVTEAKASLDKLVLEVKNVGVVFDGINAVTVSKSDDLKTRTKEVEDYLNTLIEKQKGVSSKLDDLVKEFNSKGLSVKVVGTKIVDLQDFETELQKVRTKLESLKAEKDKVDAYNVLVSERNKNAKAVLAKDSSAKKNGNVYTQTVSAKANTVGQKGNLTLNADSTVQLLSVELVSPDGKSQKIAISNNGVSKSFVSDKAGDYKVVYTFGAKENKAGSIKSVLKFDGKEAVVKTGSDQIEFTAKSKVDTTTNKTQERKPMTFVEIIDGSGSLSSTEMKEKGYKGKVDIRREQLKNIKTIIDTKLTDQDDIYLGFYTGNYEETYGVKGQSLDSGAITRKLKKAEASKLIGDLLNVKTFGVKNPNYKPNALAGSPESKEPEFISPLDSTDGAFLVREMEKTFRDLFYQIKDDDKLGFEEIIDRDRDKSKTLSVLQFTDFWYNKESMDPTFANWAKKNAKTFMTVIDREFVPGKEHEATGFKAENSENQMKALGHPNIYVRKEINASTESDIIKQFENTAVEKIEVKTTVTKQKGTVEVVASQGMKLTSVQLISPNGTSKDLPIKDGKVLFTGELEDGKYIVKYTYTGDGSVRTKAIVDGKVVTEKVSNLKSDDAVAGNSSSKIDKFEVVSLEKERLFNNNVEIQGIVLKAKEPRLEKVETEVHEVSVKAKTAPVPVKENILPHTGGVESASLSLVGLILGFVGLIGLKKKDEVK